MTTFSEHSALHKLVYTWPQWGFSTLVVRGVDSREKRLKMTDQVNDCCCLTTGDARVWNVHTPQLLHAFSACCNSKQRGVAILINRKISFTVTNTITDWESLHYGSVFMIFTACRGYPVHSLLLFLSSHQQQSENIDIQGVQTENTDHKISPYADDASLFHRNSQTSLLKRITLKDKFPLHYSQVTLNM